VRLENVRKSFGDNVVLDGIDLTVTAGERARDHRTERQRQEHAAPLRQPARADRRGRIFFEGDEITRKGVKVPRCGSGSASSSSSSTFSRTCA
jgi:hypothetical protein